MPRRIFKDPLQARLRAMEKKKSSTTKPGKLTDSFKLDPNRRNEVVQRVKQDPKRFVKSVEPGKRLENYSSEERRVYDAVKEEYFFRDLSQKRPLRSYLGELRESALFGDQNYVWAKSRLNNYLFANYGRRIEDYPKESKLRRYVEKLDAIYEVHSNVLNERF